MTIFLAILPILAAVIPFVIELWRRRVAKADSPLTQDQQRYAIIDKDIAKGDGMAATIHASSDLDELERLRNSKGH